MAIFETTWRLDVDLKTGRAQFEVEYRPESPPADHEQIHAALVEKAKQLLAQLGQTDPQWDRVTGGVVAITDFRTHETTHHELEIAGEPAGQADNDAVLGPDADRVEMKQDA